MGVFTFATLAERFEPAVGFQECKDTFFLSPAYDGRVVVFYGNPFRFILRTLPVSFLKAVVLVIAAVEYAAKDNIQRDRGPVITGTSPVAMFVQIPGQINQGTEFLVFVMNQMGDVVFIGVEAESLFFRVIIVAVRNTSTVPLPVAGSGNHGGSDTF